MSLFSRSDITVLVDWAQNTKLLTYVSLFLFFFLFFFSLSQKGIFVDELSRFSDRITTAEQAVGDRVCLQRPPPPPDPLPIHPPPHTSRPPSLPLIKHPATRLQFLSPGVSKEEMKIHSYLFTARHIAEHSHGDACNREFRLHAFLRAASCNF